LFHSRGAPHEVAAAGPFLDGQAIGALAVLARVAVAVAVQVDDLVAARRAYDVEARFVVVPGYQALEDAVVGVQAEDAVRAVDYLQPDDAPVVTLDVNGAALRAG
jgi:hypothetical protein